MAVPYLTLTDDNNNVYTFTLDFWLTDYPLDLTKNILNRSYASGGVNVADGFPEARNITVSGELRDDSLAGLETKKRALFFACMKGGKLKVSDDSVSRYIDVRDPSFSITYGDYRTEIKVTITFLCENPLWVDTTLTTDTEVVAGNASLTVDLTGSDFLVFPVIEIENDQAADNPAIRMTQQSDGSMVFEYNDASFVIGDTLVIDCENGTVQRNGNDSIACFDPARFFRLQPMSNTITYEGAACTVRFKYRKVYIA